MISLIAAAVVFLLLHLAVSGTRLRDAITARIGTGPYMGAFSLASVLGLAWLGFAFAAARHSAANDLLWSATPVTRWLQIALQFVAFELIVVGLTTPNPTSVRQEGALDRPDAVRGILRVTRHPFLWGVALWAIGHLLVSGDAAGIILFGAMLALSLFGTASIDAKRRRALGRKYDAFVAQTSNAPFLAVLQHRQRLDLGEIGWWRLALGAAVWAALAWGHPFLFGARALP
jgi:uncharacterized membrane protein